MATTSLEPRLGFGLLGVGGGALVLLLATAAGFALTWDSRLALVVAGVAGIAFLQSLGWRALIVLLVGSTFVTRARVDVLGVRLLPEHAVLLACLVALIVAGRGRDIVAAAGDRAVVLFGVFVVWSGAISLLQSPDPAKSFQIVGWLALDWLMLVVLIAATKDHGELVRHGTRWLGGAAAVAVGLWVAASLGLTSFGVQAEYTTSSRSAYGLSYESNILAAALSLWVFVVLTDPRWRASRASIAVVGLASAAIALSFTRAALVGLAAGLLVWAVLRGRIGRRLVWRVGAFVAFGVVLLLAFAPGVAAPIVEKNRQLLDFGSGNGQVRVVASLTAIDDLHGTDWLFGLGTNSYGQRHFDPTRPRLKIPGYLGNLPLQVVYDTGLVGASLLVAMLLTVLPRTKACAARSVGLLVVYFACALATSPFWFGTTWVLMAMAVVSRRRRQSSERSKQYTDASAPVPALVAV